jgi:hypothetical protein
VLATTRTVGTCRSYSTSSTPDELQTGHYADGYRVEILEQQ